MTIRPTIEWPDTLPQVVEADSFQLQAVKTTIQSDFGIEPIEGRNYAFRKHKVVSHTYYMTKAQRDTFHTFINDTLKGGHRRFLMPTWWGNRYRTATARIVGDGDSGFTEAWPFVGTCKIGLTLEVEPDAERPTLIDLEGNVLVDLDGNELLGALLKPNYNLAETTVDWPTSLPYKITADTNQVGYELPVHVTQMDDGYDLYRRNTSAPIYKVTQQWVFKGDEFGQFVDFYDYDLLYGSNWFNGYVFTGSTKAAAKLRFSNIDTPWTASILGIDSMTVAAELQWRPA
jgi:hypothetical protein